MKIRVFPVNKRMVKNTCTDQGAASLNVNTRSKQTNLPKLLPTTLSQTRVLKKYTQKTKNIKNISARRKTGNDKSILLTKKITLQIARELPSKEISITEKTVKWFALYTNRLVSKQCKQPMKGFMQAIKLISEWNCCNNILVIVKIIYNLKEIAWRNISITLQWAASIDL